VVVGSVMLGRGGENSIKVAKLIHARGRKKKRVIWVKILGYEKMSLNDSLKISKKLED